MHILPLLVAKAMIFFVINHVLVAEILFVPKKSRQMIPAVNLSYLQDLAPSHNEHSADKYATNTHDISKDNVVTSNRPKSEFLKSISRKNLKLYINSDIRSGSKKGKFSFLLDSDKNIKHNSKLMANKNINQATVTQLSAMSDMITNADIKVLQKFVKKLKKSVRVGRKGQALRTSAQHYSKSSRGDGSKVNKMADQLEDSSRQPNIKDTKDDMEKNSLVQNRIPLTIHKKVSSREGKISVQTENNLDGMSKSDVDALHAIAKEWKRLHSEGKDKYGHSEELTIPNEKNDLQRLVNKPSKERTQGNPRLIQSTNKVIKKTRNLLNAVNKGKDEINGNSISIPATTSKGETIEIPYGPGQQLKETVDKVIANTTQQLLQFIKLEKQLVGIQNGSFANDSQNEIHYTDTFINLIKAMRNSKKIDVTKTNGGNTSGRVDPKNNRSNSNKELKFKKRKPSNSMERTSWLRKSESKQKLKTDQNKITKHGEGKMDKSKVNEMDEEKLDVAHKLKQKQQIKNTNESQSQRHKDGEGNKLKSTQNVKYKQKQEKQDHQHQQKDGPISEEQQQSEHQVQDEIKQEQIQDEKKEQHQQKQQQMNREQQQNQIQEAELAETVPQNSGEKNVEDEFNIKTSEQENIKEKTLKSQNPSNDDVSRVSRHFRIETMKHLIASLAEDPFNTWIYHQKSFEELGITPSLVKAGIVNLGSSKPMQRTLRKAVLGKNIKMLVVGGSISAGGGLWKDRGNIDGVYHRALADWWERTVTPITKSKIEMNNVAIGGTDSEYFSYCINNFLESNPDIVLWELSANDYNRFNERNFDPSKPLEQLTRIILQLPSHPALIYVNFFRGDKQNFQLGEKCPDSEETEVDILSRYYDIPSLSWRRMVCSLITKRTFVNQELFGDDGYHPNLLGHAQVAMLLLMYVKGVFKSVLADDLDKIKKFNILSEGDSDFEDVFQLKIPAFKDPLKPKPSCWTLITPDYTKVFRNTLNEVNVLKGHGFELRNVTAWDVRTDRIQCLFATKPGAILDLSLDVPVLDDDRNLPLADAQTRTLAIAIHNKFGGAADVQLDELPSKTSVAYVTEKLRQTKVHVVSEDVRPGVHNLRFRSLSPGFCLTSIMVI